MFFPVFVGFWAVFGRFLRSVWKVLDGFLAFILCFLGSC